MFGLRQADPQQALSLRPSCDEKLKTQRRFAGAGFPLEQVHQAQWKSAAENIVESRDAGGNASRGGRGLGTGFSHVSGLKNGGWHSAHRKVYVVHGCGQHREDATSTAPHLGTP